jgi:hypothetical protein
MEDKVTNLVSHFHVLESFNLTPLRPGQPLIPFSFRMTAVWMRSEEDPLDAEYEYQIIGHSAASADEWMGPTGRFHFTLPFQRIIAEIEIPGVPPPGVYHVECRIRALGESDWLKQDYPLIFRLAPSPAERVGAETSHRS